MEVSPVWQACPSANMILPNQNNSKYIALFVYVWDWDVYNHLKMLGFFDLDLLADPTIPSKNPEEGNHGWKTTKVCKWRT